MSKRKKNYPDPMDIVSKYGADSIRSVVSYESKRQSLKA